MNAYHPDMADNPSVPYDMHNVRDGEVDAGINVEAEQALLGAIMLNNDVLDHVSFIEPQHFSEQIHQQIFACIRGKLAQGLRADPITMLSDLRTMQVGEINGVAYVARLAGAASTVANARDYAIEVVSGFVVRNGLSLARDMWKMFAEKGYDTSILSIISDLEERVAELRALAPQAPADTDVDSALDRLLRNIGEEPQVKQRAIPFPLPEIGTVLQEPGFQVGNLYGLLGASGEGKTSLVLQVVRSALDAGHPVLLMSYDQTDEQVLRQMISQATGISVSQMIQRRINDHEFQMVADEGLRIKKLAPFHVRSLSDHKIGAIVSLTKRWAKTLKKMARPDGSHWGAPLIILDHNRKVRAEDPRADAGSKAAIVNGAGKALARDLEAVVLFLNQRNGKGMERYVPRPIAEDLFGGEQAKEDYDSILYIYRPERWRDEQLSVARDAAEAGKITQRFMLRKNWEDTPRDPAGMAEIGAIKTRYGAGGVKEFVKFEGRYTRYVSERPTTPELF
ncbi:hypothetical protein FPY71_10160 [Aureimonas fodinaquatilis]|uniref:DNA 5'-3' helicase n=1 Tax=Aureimonas fodinaquatilis TaxID=2565783 RepID=A0A5B0DZ58_9HYPH|nr:DnaB-like helicase N-terminal domain-containing protein [Aureimonas fodinaquatilis]KAA0970830.1 hypothetical protein FPY71_10160 [Aureimonas fodinaquatilis]